MGSSSGVYLNFYNQPSKEYDLKLSLSVRVEGMGKELAPHYDTAFFEHHADGSRRSAAAVIPLVNALVKPASILDVGCGVGTWLSEWASRGVTDLLGLDGDYVDRAALQIPLSSFCAMDLQRPSSLNRKFDLVESLEVVEHL